MTYLYTTPSTIVVDPDTNKETVVEGKKEERKIIREIDFVKEEDD